MSGVAVRVGVGARFRYDGELVEVVELVVTAASCEVLVKDGRGRVARLALRELLQNGQVIPDGPGPAADDGDDPAAVVLSQLSAREHQLVSERAGHVQEVLTGFSCGDAGLAVDGEPREAYAPQRLLGERFAGGEGGRARRGSSHGGTVGPWFPPAW